jgi:hypothetical protein
MVLMMVGVKMATAESKQKGVSQRADQAPDHL